MATYGGDTQVNFGSLCSNILELKSIQYEASYFCAKCSSLQFNK